ncbi:MAG: ABC transporter ATP-binding protein [Acidimicrobiia bacterium]|nr:ABC transporter ATP-binding protein [Acidimicrobiia bacterium]
MDIETPIIETDGLTKYYGDVPGIIDLDLSVIKGEVFGFLGPNGAGKTTTIRLLLNFLFPTSGSARVLGLDVVRDSLEIRRRIGYLPGDLALYDTMTARELFLYFSNLRKMDTTARVAELAERFDLDLDRKIKDYSTGNRQKVGLVNAFMHDPELLILDEPTVGLDPLVQQEFQALVTDTKAAGRTMFLSSHILSEVDRVADRAGIVREGRLVAVDTIEAFKAKAHATVALRFAAAVPPDEFLKCEGVVNVATRHDDALLVITVAGSVDAVIKTAAKYHVESISTRDGELEEVFLSYYSGSTHGR